MEEDFVEAKSLWGKFLSVTREMHKFLLHEDIDTFLALLEQRLQLQKRIESLPQNKYHLSQEGKRVIGEINPINVAIQHKVQMWLNKTKKNQNMARAYDSLGYGMTGSQINREF